jgi:hypothetical protein
MLNIIKMNSFTFNSTIFDSENNISCCATLYNPDENDDNIRITFECLLNENTYSCVINESKPETLVRMYTFLHLLDQQNQRYMTWVNLKQNELWIFDKNDLNLHSIVKLRVTNNTNTSVENVLYN